MSELREEKTIRELLEKLQDSRSAEFDEKFNGCPGLLLMIVPERALFDDMNSNIKDWIDRFQEQADGDDSRQLLPVLNGEYPLEDWCYEGLELTWGEHNSPSMLGFVRHSGAIELFATVRKDSRGVIVPGFWKDLVSFVPRYVEAVRSICEDGGEVYLVPSLAGAKDFNFKTGPSQELTLSRGVYPFRPIKASSGSQKQTLEPLRFQVCHTLGDAGSLLNSYR